MLRFKSSIKFTVLVLAVSLCANGLQMDARAACTKIYDDGQLAVCGNNPPGVVEPPVPAYYNGQLEGHFTVLEVYDKVPGQTSWPLTVVDIIANTYVRTIYQPSEPVPTVPPGTSVVGSPSYRTAAGLHEIPTVLQAELFTGEPDRYRTVVSAQFGTDASVYSIRTFPDPDIGLTTTGLTIGFEAQQNITLHPGFLGNDAFRMGSMGSMFSDESQYDADLLRWTDPDGTLHSLRLTNATPRNAHLFSSPMEISVDSFVELVKEHGSTWFPTSPSVRIDLLGLSGITGRIGIQGWLASTLGTSDDSLDVWIEWIDAPPMIPSGAVYEATYLVSATPPTPRPGDADMDGDVDLDDFVILKQNFATGTTWDEGDFDLDGDVDLDDFVILKKNFGTAAAP